MDERAPCCRPPRSPGWRRNIGIAPSHPPIAQEAASAQALRAYPTSIQLQGRSAEHQRDLEVAAAELRHAERFRKTDDELYSRHEIVELTTRTTDATARPA